MKCTFHSDTFLVYFDKGKVGVEGKMKRTGRIYLIVDFEQHLIIRYYASNGMEVYVYICIFISDIVANCKNLTILLIYDN